MKQMYWKGQNLWLKWSKVNYAFPSGFLMKTPNPGVAFFPEEINLGSPKKSMKKLVLFELFFRKLSGFGGVIKNLLFANICAQAVNRGFPKPFVLFP